MTCFIDFGIIEPLKKWQQRVVNKSNVVPIKKLQLGWRNNSLSFQDSDLELSEIKDLNLYLIHCSIHIYCEFFITFCLTLLLCLYYVINHSYIAARFIYMRPKSQGFGIIELDILYILVSVAFLSRLHNIDFIILNDEQATNLKIQATQHIVPRQGLLIESRFTRSQSLIRLSKFLRIKISS